ncbi:hypothetical protein I6F35_12235 [Bradyrhizobium sp. BRP22]|uniref:hypothetical protein n=1 Tax=Bradyrhizobium sp. BRP22 TaxID=2793821 RepID=UPI001CD49DBD|nr:hypothetical protein [Bradyrhizobium sp. BRP22]MCA1453980.1 hypothetical protein [Bradyrhizobium sp. BRP22]
MAIGCDGQRTVLEVDGMAKKIPPPWSAQPGSGLDDEEKMDHEILHDFAPQCREHEGDSAEPRYRFPHFGANGFYPGRGRAPSPLQPEQIATAMAFLQMFRPTKHGTLSSYFLKHAAENWGGKIGLCSYVSNGALILAALMLGLVVEPHRPDWLLSPNADIGISRRDFRRITGSY